MTDNEDLFDQAMNFIERYASIVCKQPNNSATLEKLESEMLYYSNAQAKHAAFEKALNEKMAEVDAVKTKEEAEKVFKAYEKQIIKISNMNVENAERLKRFVAMNLNKSIGDDDVLITQNTISTIDPISKQRMVDPVKNKKCGHHYEKSTVLQMIARNPAMRCPMIGCSVKVVRAKDLVPDDQLKRYLENHVDERLEISAVDLDETK